MPRQEGVGEVSELDAEEIFKKVEERLLEFYGGRNIDQASRAQLVYAFQNIENVMDHGWQGKQDEVKPSHEVPLRRWSEGKSSTVESILASIPIVKKDEKEVDYWNLTRYKLNKDAYHFAKKFLRLVTPDVSEQGNEGDVVLKRLKALGGRCKSPLEFLKEIQKQLQVNDKFAHDVRREDIDFTFQCLWPVMGAVYGQRMEYWAEARRMLAEFEKKEEEKKNLEIKKRDAEFAQNQQRLKHLEAIVPSEAEGLVGRIEVHGDKELRGSEYIEAGLGPKYLVPLGSKDGHEQSFYVSEPFELGSKRLGVIFYVPQGDNLIARSYYLSNSSCQWRYLPAYWQVGGQVRHFDKGWDKCSLPTPTYFQRALADLSNNVSAKKFSSEDWQKYFLGTARSIINKDVAARTYKEEVHPVAQKLPGNFYSNPEGKKLSPEQVDFHSTPEAQKWKPDFSEVVMSWTQKSKQHGEIFVEVFYSKNGKCSYSFYNNNQGRSCVSVEMLGEIGSTGLRSEWVDPGDLGTPLVEYYEQARGYGGEGVDNDYQEMWSKYLSKIPLIKEYQESKKKRGEREQAGQTRELRLRSQFENAKSFEELYQILKSIDSIPGASDPTITGEKWIEIIKKVMRGSRRFNYVTSGSGLRKAVQRLSEIEGVREGIS